MCSQVFLLFIVGKEVNSVVTLFLVTVAATFVANVASHVVCKWLDKRDKRDR